MRRVGGDESQDLVDDVFLLVKVRTAVYQASKYPCLDCD